MAFCLNRVMLLGRAGKDLAIKVWDNGKSTASFTMVTSESWIEKGTGIKKEVSSWHTISVLSDYMTRELSNSGFTKGCWVLVIGMLKSYETTDPENGQKKISIKVEARSIEHCVRVVVDPGKLKPYTEADNNDEIIPF